MGNEIFKNGRILRKRRNADLEKNGMLRHDVDLYMLNTLKIKAKAKDFFTIGSEADLLSLYNLCKRENFNKQGKKIFALGEGSNTVFAGREVDALIVKINLKGRYLVNHDNEYVWVDVAAGELFRDFVLWTCENGFSGLENLAAIYGTVGAAPVQNIGAYGCEVRDCIDSVRYFDLNDGQFYTVSAEECTFGYRYSVFKYQDGAKIITNVIFKLKKNFVFNDSYEALAKSFANVKKTDITPLLVAKKVTEIRNGKLPDPRKFGNCGSFFKNPVISKEHYNNLKAIYDDMVAFEDGDNMKISAAWLIERCGFKGKKINNVGMYPKQALILVNYGVENIGYIISYAEEIIKTVKLKFDIDLVPEPHYVY